MNKQQEPKKLYSPGGKRKFKAKVIDSSVSSQEVFVKAAGDVPSGGGDPNILEKLRFRMTNHNYQTEGAEEASSEKKPSKKGKAKKPVSEGHFKPGEAFKVATDDFRVEEK